MTKEGGDRVSPLKRYFVVPRYILPFYPNISEVRLWQEVVYNPLACQDAFRDDRMGMWRVHVHQRRLHVPRLSDDDDGSCRSPPPPPPPPPLPAYDVAQLQAGEAVGPEGVDANKFDFLAAFFFSALFWAMVGRPMTTIASLNLILRNYSLRVFWNVRNILRILNLSMSSKVNC